ncbi:50S ribosomal protein L33 [Enterococcus faecalis]
MRQTITIACAETGERLYLTSKNKQNTREKLQMKKYSTKLRRRALFTEVK